MDRWTGGLVAEGVAVLGLDAHHLRLTWQGHSAVFQVRQTQRPLSPSELAAPPAVTSLLVVPRASHRLRDRARALGWSLVVGNATAGWLRFPDGGVLELTEPTSVAAPSPEQPSSRGFGVWTLTRLLLQQPPTTQVELSRAAGLSQPRVSQLLQRLVADGLVRSSRLGWAPHDWDALCDWWLAHYPGPGGVTTWWYGLRPPAEQLPAVLRALATADAQPHPALVSGDVAIDLADPWRRPASLTVYTPVGADLAGAGLTAATGAGDATTALVVPADPGVAAMPASAGGAPHLSAQTSGPPLADGLQVLYDLLRAGGSDAPEAAQRWRHRLRTHQERLTPGQVQTRQRWAAAIADTRQGLRDGSRHG